MAAGFSVTISAADQATATIERINKKLQAINAPIERMNAQFAKFSRLSGLNDLSRGMDRLARSAVDVFRNISQIIAPLGAITGAASLAGMYRMASAWGIWAQHQDIVAKRIGITADKLQTFEGVARLAGSSTGAMDSGLQNLRDRMFEINNNAASAETVLSFRRLGLTSEWTKSHINNLADALPEVMQRLHNIKDPTLFAAAAQGIFGSATAELAPVLQLTGDALNDYIKRVQAHGIATGAQRQKLTGLAQSEEDLRQSVGGLGLAMSAAVSGPMSDLLDGLSHLIDANRDVIATKVGEYFEQFARWIHRVDWTSVARGVGRFARETEHLGIEIVHAVQWMDRMGLTGPLLGGILATKLLGPLSGIAAKLLAIGAWKMPGWIASVLGLSTGAVTALGSTLLLSGDTPGGAAPDAISVEDAQKRVDEINSKYGYNGSFLHDMGQGIRNLFNGGGSTPALPTGVTNQLARQAFDYYTAHGLSPQAAAGVVAGGVVESGMNARSIGDNGQAYGIGQWHPDRQANFARMFGHPIQQSTFEEQLAFKLAELNGTAGDSQSALAGSVMRRPGETARQAGMADSIYAERPGDIAGEATRRGELAEQLFAKFTAGGAPILVPAPTASGAPLAMRGTPDRLDDERSNGSPGAATLSKLDVTIRHQNAPAGATVTARASGDAINGAPKIETSLPGVGGGAE